MTDLVKRIGQLSNEDAVGALDLFLQHQDPDAYDLGLKAEEEERRFRQVLADPGARREFEAQASIEPSPADWDDLARGGDLARSALAYLANQSETVHDDVAHAIDRPAPVGMRDPVTLAIIGLVVLALRPKIDIERDPQKGWRLRFATEPLKDAAMAKVLGKLLSAIFPSSSKQ
jgi:hypothetical protein